MFPTVRRIPHRRATAISLGCQLPGTSSSLPESHSGSDQTAVPFVTNGTCPLFGLALGGVYLASRVTSPAGVLLPHRFTLTCSPRSTSGRQLPAVYFLLHFPGPHGRSVLPITLSCSARTFLPPLTRPATIQSTPRPPFSITEEAHRAKYWTRWSSVWFAGGVCRWRAGWCRN